MTPSSSKSDAALRILRDTYGYASFRPQQADIIHRLIGGGDAMVLMPTGGGKSLCYQIPAIVRRGTGIVISPLIALMQDQVDAMQQLGVKAAFLNSTLDAASAEDIERQLAGGALDLLYVAPERLLMPRMLELLARTDIALFAIDEAHCVSQWGHDFRKEYMQLCVLHEQFQSVPRIALTATADERTRQEIVRNLSLERAGIYISGFDRPNIRYTISEGSNARDRLWRFLEQEHAQDAGIVYCLSRKKVEQVAEWLRRKGRDAHPYHAGMPASERRFGQDRFLRDDGVIIVATIAFGMGIDKPDVRFVAHLNLPKSVEAYYQETGRAGRDGQPANAWMAYGLQDVITLRRMMLESDADELQKRVEHHKLEAMLGFCELTSCRRRALLEYFGETFEADCGNCDNCLSPPATWDGTEAARKALSCVYRTGQRFGVNYVIDVLTGKDNERIPRFGHQRLSTYGIGAELSGVEWRALFRQLVAAGLLDVDIEGYGGLRLTEAARPVLRGEQRLQLRRTPKPEKKADTSRNKDFAIGAAEQPLWEALRACRTRLAAQAGVPPYVIFHDRTLKEMLERRPRSEAELSQISGVGQHKLDKYGHEFLEVISVHPVAAPEALGLSEDT